MKILHIIPSLRKGGAERIVLDICIELQNRFGIEVCLVTLSSLCEYADLASQVNLIVIPSRFTPSITGKHIKDVEGLNAFFNSFKPDVVHTHLWEAEIVARQVDYDSGVWFTHFHDNMHQLAKLSWPITKLKLTNWYERFLMLKEYKRRNSNFICISENSYRYGTSMLPKYLNGKVTLLPNSINILRFENKNHTPIGETIQLVSIGSLLKNKNHVFLVSVVDLLKNKGYKVCLTIIGEGVERKIIESLIKKLDLDYHVKLVGSKNNPELDLWNSNIYVHSSFSEAFGLTIVEAMAAGLPVVTLNGGGNADILENGKNGYILNEQDPQKFADLIVQLWQDKTLYRSISQYAEEYAKRYDIKEYADKLLCLYSGTN